MLKKIFLLLNTVRFLKIKQIQYQAFYRLRKPRALAAYSSSFVPEKLHFLSFKDRPLVFNVAQENNSFTFLNVEVKFGGSIDWSYDRNGKLWNYNLQYGNYLLQEEISFEKRIEWLRSLYVWLQEGKISLEPYPASLRAINAMRLLSCYKYSDEDVLHALHAELDFLYRRPEYHLLGNHLLENSFALIMGGAFFAEGSWLKKGKEILISELNEQILSDGAHFELSPMYHQIILFRLLELIDWYCEWEGKEETLLTLLTVKAGKMLSWLRNITFQNGDIPHFNDSAPGIAYSSKYLLDYGKRLGLIFGEGTSLGESGYRKFNFKKYECVVDVAKIGPSYQPGHAHADALSFILYAKNQPVLVEKGTSTYEVGKRRNIERSSGAHNTLIINGKDQSEVWGGFRVARRAKVNIKTDNLKQLEGSHNGYQRHGYTHNRRFEFEEAKLVIKDTVERLAGEEKDVEIVIYFHIHPDREVNMVDKTIQIDDSIMMKFEGASDCSIVGYDMADGFNKYKKGKVVKVSIDNALTTTIGFN